MRKLLPTLAFLLLPSLALALPTFDAVTVNTGSSLTTMTFNHTVGGTCTNIYIILGNSTVGIPPTMSGVTIGGSPATSLIAVNTPGGDRRSQMYGLARGSSTGSTAISITYSDTGGVDSAAAISYCGVDQASTGNTSTSSNNDGSAAPALTVTSSATELVIDCLSNGSGGSDSISAGSGQTSRVSDNTWGASTVNRFLFRMSEKTGASSTAMTWTGHVTGDDYAYVGVALKSVAVAGGVARRRIISQ